MYADVTLRLPSTSVRWHRPEFRTELTEWVSSVVGQVSSIEPVHDRPWSTVWRAETADGMYFAKQNTPLQGFEAALMLELAALAPEHIVLVTAADPARDLLLTPFLGPVLGEAAGDLDEAAMVALSTRVVVAGAELQRLVAPHADRLVGAGLVPLGPREAPGYVRKRIEDFAELSSDDPRAISAEARHRLEWFLPAFEESCAELAGLGLPATLQHNDLHQWNVFEIDGELRFFDFGDALLSDPLAALWVPLGGLAARLECPVGDPRVMRVADAALEFWSDRASMTDLRRVLPTGLRLGRLCRAESWIRCNASMTDEELAEYGDKAAYWLEAPATLEL